MKRNTAKKLVQAAKDAAAELERLRDVLLPQYEDKVAGPDYGVLHRLRIALEQAQKEEKP